MNTEEYVPPGEPGGEDALPLPPDFTPEDPDPPLYIPPPEDSEIPPSELPTEEV